MNSGRLFEREALETEWTLRLAQIGAAATILIQLAIQ